MTGKSGTFCPLGTQARLGRGKGACWRVQHRGHSRGISNNQLFSSCGLKVLRLEAYEVLGCQVRELSRLRLAFFPRNIDQIQGNQLAGS